MKETLYKEVQEILENDLSCAICQDIYINPLILNCSHSFCKFCVYRWLSKRPGCPQCRMTVSFQAENLALRNIINRMIQKSSPQFQTTRSTNVSQRLKDEEAQEKEGVVPKLVIKNGSQSANPISDNNSSNVNNNNRYNREHALALSRIHERSSRLLASGDHDYVVNIGLDHNLASLLDDFNRSDSDDDEWSYEDDEDPESPEEDDDEPSDDHNDVTFELGSSSEESAESSDEADENDDDDDDMDDNDDLNLDDMGVSDMESSDNNDDNEDDDDADVDDDFQLESSFSDLQSSSESSSESSDDDEQVVEIDDSSTEVDSEASCSSNRDYANWSARIADDDIALPNTESDSETTSDDGSSEDDLTEEYDQSDDDTRDSDSSMELNGDGRYEDDDTSISSDY